MKKNPVNNYKSSRFILLLVIIDTLFNFISAFVSANIFLPVGATIPMLFTILGVAGALSGATVILIIILLLYLLCWILSKKNYKWMIGAAVLYAIDTIVMFWFYGLSFDATRILDMIIHVYIMYCFISGCISGKIFKEKTYVEEKEL